MGSYIAVSGDSFYLFTKQYIKHVPFLPLIYYIISLNFDKCLLILHIFIQSATKNIELIVENILQSDKLMTPESLAVGLIAYRSVISTFSKKFI